jgi:hypothetical protein
VALIINAIDIGFKYMSTENPAVKLFNVYKIAIDVIKAQAGNIQINKVRNAREYPPNLYPINTMVCVDEAPGSN